MKIRMVSFVVMVVVMVLVILSSAFAPCEWYPYYSSVPARCIKHFSK